MIIDHSPSGLRRGRNRERAARHAGGAAGRLQGVRARFTYGEIAEGRDSIGWSYRGRAAQCRTGRVRPEFNRDGCRESAVNTAQRIADDDLDRRRDNLTDVRGVRLDEEVQYRSALAGPAIATGCADETGARPAKAATGDHE